MSEWREKVFGDSISAAPSIEKIRAASPPVFLAAGKPEDFGVFTHHDLRSGIMTIYFSPSASVLAEAFGATPCEKPSVERLVFLVGHTEAARPHYPTFYERH